MPSLCFVHQTKDVPCKGLFSIENVVKQGDIN